MSAQPAEFQILPKEETENNQFKQMLSQIAQIQSGMDNLNPIDLEKASFAFWFPFGNPECMSLMIYDDNTHTKNGTFALISVGKDLKLPYKMGTNQQFILKSGGMAMVGSSMKIPFEQDLKKRGIKPPYHNWSIFINFWFDIVLFTITLFILNTMQNVIFWS